MKKVKLTIVLVLALLLVTGPKSWASMYLPGYTGPIDFDNHPYAWNPGANTARVGGDPAPGGATWSVMAPGIGDSGGDPHGGNPTSDLTALYAGGVDEITTIGLCLDKWAAVSLFTNLGQVADGGGLMGTSLNGDIRVGALVFDGPSNVLAHAYYPGTTGGGGGGSGSNYGGDMHFDEDEAWSDGAVGGGIDFHTVALHELGHSLGLGHSTVFGSVMYPFYGGVLRTLAADDIAGIQAIYGVPVPGALLLGILGLSAAGAKLRRFV